MYSQRFFFVLAIFILSSIFIFAEETAGQRPYEMVNAGRNVNPNPPLVNFENITGWTVDTVESEAKWERSAEQRIWGEGVGNMADFTLNTVSHQLKRKKPFGIAFNFVSSFLHLTEEQDAVSHLRCIADVLTKGGLYILGIHLLPEGRSDCQQEHWHVRHGNLTLQSCLRRKSLDKKKRLETVEFKIHAYTPKKNYTVCDTLSLRTYTLKQFTELLRKVNRFSVIETFDFNLGWKNPIPLTEKTEDVVFVLQKR
ncbi:hypothetical protein FACS189427_13570 [Planctomycetales bacterium]|nr:hypothetical protein FACS189427_13570 [Planctomycetales bacterium]